MRLRLSSLPNIMHSAWARLCLSLSLSLRHTERTLGDSIAHNGLSTYELSGMHFTSDHVVSLLLFRVAYLQFVPQPVAGEDATVPGSDFGFATVYAMLQHYTTFFLEDCRSPVRLSAALCALPSFESDSSARRVPRSRPLFFGEPRPLRNRLVSGVAAQQRHS
ncbi:hypothetical protein LMJF_33_0180 [Leishmania major strain Friedlin]|uniref:Secreted protein n=1 Tax=Leishmania major TaxID=5664 RepID=Q4Q4K5_LEIMA|nr:hypothetical protein LMJF_33_0180 [Leishmania major strain Friedlin]CAJ05869.1 hypothetical protein LMJF_33_0180 [Leishmania major strain Friedlin]|eukprot:XP_001685743.1 hypothetical protein LMJF_33_0180 [Leishmania major strain Friedlin]